MKHTTTLPIDRDVLLVWDSTNRYVRIATKKDVERLVKEMK